MIRIWLSLLRKVDIEINCFLILIVDDDEDTMKVEIKDYVDVNLQASLFQKMHGPIDMEVPEFYTIKEEIIVDNKTENKKEDNIKKKDDRNPIPDELSKSIYPQIKENKGDKPKSILVLSDEHFDYNEYSNELLPNTIDNTIPPVVINVTESKFIYFR